MTNEERFRYFLIRAEQVQLRIEKMEEEVLARYQADPTRNQGQGPWAEASKELDKDQGYRGMVNRRTAYQEQAHMYGLGAILDALQAGNSIRPQDC
jgi:hypothetical protein